MVDREVGKIYSMKEIEDVLSPWYIPQGWEDEMNHRRMAYGNNSKKLRGEISSLDERSWPTQLQQLTSRGMAIGREFSSYVVAMLSTEELEILRQWNTMGVVREMTGRRVKLYDYFVSVLESYFEEYSDEKTIDIKKCS